jgi:hypothetical protein
MRVLRSRFWLELCVGVGCAVLAVLTVFWPQWIEEVLGVDPDAGSGALEWAIVVVLAVSAIALPLRARVHWLRLRELRGEEGS